MGINVGTLVQPYQMVDIDTNEPVMERTCFLEGKTDQCIGIVVSMDIKEFSDMSTAKVRWVQNCPNHLESHTEVQSVFLDNLWEIGQLY